MVTSSGMVVCMKFHENLSVGLKIVRERWTYKDLSYKVRKVGCKELCVWVICCD